MGVKLSFTEYLVRNLRRNFNSPRSLSLNPHHSVFIAITNEMKKIKKYTAETYFLNGIVSYNKWGNITLSFCSRTIGTHIRKDLKVCIYNLNQSIPKTLILHLI